MIEEKVATDPVARLVQIRHAICRFGVEVNAMKPDDSSCETSWASASDGFCETSSKLLDFEEMLVERTQDKGKS